MSRARRVLAMLTGSLAVLGFGFVVAVAAESLPGRDGDEPMLDVAFRADLDLTPIFAWILLFLAIAGAVLFAMGLKEAKPRKEGGNRSILGILIGLVLFVVIFRWARPAAEAFLEEGAASATDPATEVIGDGEGGGGAGVWVFSLLLAAILAAALTRIALSIRTTISPFGQSTTEARVELPLSPPIPVIRSLGTDPRSRILSAYEAFESDLAMAGQPRADTETTRHHAWRAAEQLDLDPDVVRALVDQHAAARYGRSEPAESDAESAERSFSILQERIIA